MNLIQSVSFVSSTTESLRIPSHVLEAAHYFKEYCYEEIHFIIICHHWTLKIGISWRFTEHFAAVFSACRVSTQLPGVLLFYTAIIQYMSQLLERQHFTAKMSRFRRY